MTKKDQEKLMEVYNLWNERTQLFTQLADSFEKPSDSQTQFALLADAASYMAEELYHVIDSLLIAKEKHDGTKTKSETA